MNLKMHVLTNFPTFFTKVKSQALPFKTSYKLALLAQEIEKHINFYQENFRNLLQEYGKKDSDGNLIFTQDGQGILLIEERTEEAYAKIEELRNLDVELPDTKFSLDDFNNIGISPEEMLIIMPFIEV